MILSTSTLDSTGWRNSARINLNIKVIKQIQDFHIEQIKYINDIIVPIVLSGNTNIPIGVYSDDLPNGEATANKLEIETDNGLSAQLYQRNIGEEDEHTVLKLDCDAVTVFKDEYSNVIDVFNNNIRFKSTNLNVSIEPITREININQRVFEYDSQQKKLLHIIVHNLDKVVVETKIYKKDEFGNYHEIIAKVDYLSSNNLRIILTTPEHIKCVVKY